MRPNIPGTAVDIASAKVSLILLRNRTGRSGAIKRTGHATEVVVSTGPEQAQEQLRAALAVG